MGTCKSRFFIRNGRQIFDNMLPSGIVLDVVQACSLHELLCRRLPPLHGHQLKYSGLLCYVREGLHHAHCLLDQCRNLHHTQGITTCSIKGCIHLFPVGNAPHTWHLPLLKRLVKSTYCLLHQCAMNVTDRSNNKVLMKGCHCCLLPQYMNALAFEIFDFNKPSLLNSSMNAQHGKAKASCSADYVCSSCFGLTLSLSSESCKVISVFPTAGHLRTSPSWSSLLFMIAY